MNSTDAQVTTPPRWRWYHGVLFYVGVQVFSFALGKVAQRHQRAISPQVGELVVGNEAYNAFYNRLVQPVFSPPDWSFAPVWTTNNALCVWGLLRALNLPQDTPGRTAFLSLQGIVWLAFAAFNALYFGLRSPINGAISTNIGLGATIASVYVALTQVRDTRVALSQSTIFPWLVIAAATANSVAAWNRDEYYNAGPFIAPPAAWAKPLVTSSEQG